MKAESLRRIDGDHDGSPQDAINRSPIKTAALIAFPNKISSREILISLFEQTPHQTAEQ
jgi:hypothetical protein